MTKRIALGMAALIGLSTAIVSFSAAEALPLPNASGYRTEGQITQVRDYRRGYYRGGPRYYGGGPRYYGPRGGYYNGGAAALGVLGGLALGGAIAAPRYYGPECYIVRREVWVPGYGYRIRRVEVCE